METKTVPILYYQLDVLWQNCRGPWPVVHVSSAVGQQKQRSQNTVILVVGRQLYHGHIRASKTASQERQPDCFSTHTQDPITNSLCKFPDDSRLLISWWPHCFCIWAKATKPENAQSVLPVPAQAMALLPCLWIQLTSPHYYNSYLDLATCRRILSSHENIVYQLCDIIQNIVGHSAL